ncbi:hypothetical protein BVX99_02405, partial [bacterium F16]
MKIDRHPDPVIDKMIDQAAQFITQGMSPMEVGMRLYPNADPIELASVPAKVITDHLSRYSMRDLVLGQ